LEELTLPTKKCRHWYEMQPKAKEYREAFSRKWRLALKLNRNLAMSFAVLPSGFFCWHFNEKLPKEARLHTVVPIAMAKANGSFEYDMLELEHGFFRYANRVIELRRSRAAA